MWANLHLLFWLSLFPFVTGFAGENHFNPLPTALYGLVLLMAAIAYYILQTLIIRDHGRDSHLARSLGGDFKGRSSPLFYATAMFLAFYWPWVSATIYIVVALMWLVPDRRLERVIAEGLKT